jgi:hypothetical protein
MNIRVTGLITFTNTSIIGEAKSAILSVFFKANILGSISQKMSMKIVETKVAQIIPHLPPIILTNIAETMTEKEIFAKLFPIKIPTISLSECAINRWMLALCFTALASMWRRRILLKPIIEVSVREKKNDRTAKINNNIIIKGKENSELILS